MPSSQYIRLLTIPLDCGGICTMMKRGTILLLSMVVAAVASAAAWAPVDVGVVLDIGSLVGKIGRTSVSMAVDDFYESHGNYTFRLVLHTRDSHSDILESASQALDLLENTQVKAIIGPQKSKQAIFISELARAAHVPLLSFSATSPAITAPYFVRTTAIDSSQVPAITALIKLYGWRQAVLICEDTYYGRDIVPYLFDAFEGINTDIPYQSIIPVSASEDKIAEELYKLMTMQTRVFVVHMSVPVGSLLFSKAREIGMMSKGYVWIMTDGLTGIVDSLDPSVINSMQGALGVKVHIPLSKAVDDFALRWQRRFQRENPDDPPTDVSIYGRWAYDTVWALAMAVEKAGAVNSMFTKSAIVGNTTELERLGVSEVGPRLLDAILDTGFTGVSGEFRIVKGQLKYMAYEIVNVVGRGGRRIGFWTSDRGISRKLELPIFSNGLNPVIWPGESDIVPLGWEIPTSGKKLRIGVPVIHGYVEFVKVEKDLATKSTAVTGYCIDVFEAVIQKLPYALPHEYEPFENSQGQMAGTYDDLVHQVYLQKYDAVVGDTTISAKRSFYVDFTLPYTKAGVAMIVPVKDTVHKNAWIFLKPLTTDLWLGSLAFFFFTGTIIWVMEHRINDEFRGSISRQLGTIFYFSFSTLVFAHRERVEHILSRVVVVIWVFVMLILTSSYTASLTSLLTVQQLQPTITNLQELQDRGDYIGYPKDSFVVDLLKQLKFDVSKLRGYNQPKQYLEALSKGSKNGGVAAFVDEIPYIKLFLAKYCTGYTMVGPIFDTAGFGFVFPKGAPLTNDISRMILNEIEGEDMMAIKNKWFGDPNACQNQGTIVTSNSLNFRSFWGLFLITGATSTCSLFIYLSIFFYKHLHELRNINPNKTIWRRIPGWIRYYNTKDHSFHTFTKEKSIDEDGDSIKNNDIADIELQHPSSTPNLSDVGEEENTSTEEGSPNS